VSAFNVLKYLLRCRDIRSNFVHNNRNFQLCCEEKRCDEKQNSACCGISLGRSWLCRALLFGGIFEPLATYCWEKRCQKK
jgi:hypothetical protein